MKYQATIFAGIPAANPALFRRARIAAGDPAAWIEARGGESTLIIRDIEVERARRASRATIVRSPRDFTPPGGLSADRETATAEALAHALHSMDVDSVRADRTLPLIYVWHIERLGIKILYDPDLGVAERRQKSDQELQWLAAAQEVTERAMQMACGSIAAADVQKDGTLSSEGFPLTCERVRASIAKYLLDLGYLCDHGSIVATVPRSADCHDRGEGALKTGRPVIVDIFPRCEETHYFGDCTRTVVHGDVPAEVARMHTAVLAAKNEATKLLLPGMTADAVHRRAVEVLQAHGFRLSRGTISDEPTIQHGTGHGIGLEVHEPILLDDGGGELLENEVFTVEPGLYGRIDGGVRVEDMIVVTSQGPRNLNRIHEGLDWRD